jgi:hypothetical protein
MTEQNVAMSADEWVELCEALMRGLVHALNNRITVMSAYIQVLEMGDEDLSPQDVLPPELSQLEQTIGHLRALAVEKLPAEAIELLPVIQEAIALHAHHPHLRDVRCAAAQPASGLAPVRVPRWAITRLLLILIGAAKSASLRAGLDSFVVGLEGDDRFLSVRLVAGDEESPYARWLAALCGGTIERTNGATLLRLPSLLEVRRLERKAREES